MRAVIEVFSAAGPSLASRSPEAARSNSSPDAYLEAELKSHALQEFNEDIGSDECNARMIDMPYGLSNPVAVKGKGAIWAVGWASFATATAIVRSSPGFIDMMISHRAFRRHSIRSTVSFGGWGHRCAHVCSHKSSSPVGFCRTRSTRLVTREHRRTPFDRHAHECGMATG